MFKKVVVGGTFDRLHAGHKRILDVAFDVAGEVIIGVTSDDFANRFRTTQVSAFAGRKKELDDFCKVRGKPYQVIEINDSYGIATLQKDIDCIVVSEETLLRGEEINTIRFKKGLDKLIIVVVPLVNASDGKPISTERIIRGEIDEDGK